MTEQGCSFCKKLAEQDQGSQADVVWQFPGSVALLGPWQFYRGYCLLVSRRHATELSQLADEERRGFLEEMCLLARAIEEGFRPHKLNYELLGNQVPHLHWHLFPRYPSDPELLRPVWLALDRAEREESERRRLVGEVDRAESAERLRQVLRSLTGTGRASSLR